MNPNISTLIAALEREVDADQTGAAICCDASVDESVLIMTRSSALQLATYLLREVEFFDSSPEAARTGDAITKLLWALPSFHQPRICSSEIVATRADVRKCLGLFLSNEPEVVTALSFDPDFQDTSEESSLGEQDAAPNP
jgi:hypothetical protein